MKKEERNWKVEPFSPFFPLFCPPLQAISCVSSADEHRVIDVFVLFVLHSITAHKKTVEKVFAAKVKAGCFSDDLMNSVFGSHPGVRV